MKINVNFCATRLVIGALVFSFVVPPLSAAPSPLSTTTGARLTILGVGQTDRESSGAFQLVESRVKHWLERELAESGKGADVVIPDAAENLSLGPSLQQAYAVLAIKALRENDEGQFKHHLEKAVLINPSHEVKTIDFANLMEGKVNAEEVLKWDRETKRVGQQIQRNCVIDLKIAPANAEVRINGFLRVKKDLLRLAKRIKHRIEVRAEGYQPSAVEVECQRPGYRRLRIGLREMPKRPLVGKWLAEEAQKNVSSTWYLIERVGQGFRFYLFTPGVSLDEVPMERPLSVRDVIDNPSADTLPIAQAGFQSLMLRHRAVRVADLSSQKGLLVPSVEDNVSVSSSWYQDWRVWAFLGGVAAVAAVSFLATKDNGVQTQPAGIRVPFP